MTDVRVDGWYEYLDEDVSDRRCRAPEIRVDVVVPRLGPTWFANCAPHLVR